MTVRATTDGPRAVRRGGWEGSGRSGSGGGGGGEAGDAGSGGGDGGSKGTSSTSTVLSRLGAGTWSLWPQTLQSAFWPAFRLFTVYVALQTEQAKWMGIVGLAQAHRLGRRTTREFTPTKVGVNDYYCS